MQHLFEGLAPQRSFECAEHYVHRNLCRFRSPRIAWIRPCLSALLRTGTRFLRIRLPKQIFQALGCLFPGRLGQRLCLWIFFGDAVFPVSARIGCAAQSPEHFRRHLLVGQHRTVVPVQLKLRSAAVVMSAANAAAVELLALHRPNYSAICAETKRFPAATFQDQAD